MVFRTNSSYARTIAQNALEVAEQREGLDDSVDYFMSQMDAPPPRRFPGGAP
ncbi:g2014 [Coccomyxa viridis]|uniref:G2014 protein n=1 Tax=Coccomyxa viridis TaxID=1274662 RepID=A0ABP1FPK4_9CHLO